MNSIESFTATRNVPNAPCGVESILNTRSGGFLFLRVPNAPCGVERRRGEVIITLPHPVPNAPCGVERSLALMSPYMAFRVPNAPCGVESFHGDI